MLRLSQIKLNINHNENDLINKIAKILNTKKEDIISYKINKKSIDARKKDNIMYVYEIDIEVKNENKFKNIPKTPNENYIFKISGQTTLKNKIIIVGAGPAGLFAAYMLSKHGYKPTIIEQGEDIDTRVKTINEFWKTNKLNKNSNVQFGAGGAGTFSDGKLNTGNKDKLFRDKEVLKIFVKNEAPKEILYLNKPHIGTDKLQNVIKNMINEIIEMGGSIKYNTKLTNLIIENNTLKQIEINNNELIDCDNLILAIGHSSRDTFQMLYENNLTIKPKPFAIGVRLQHPQKLINESQYGNNKLPPASYKLTHQTTKKRGVYSFCMCPGGYVVNASSEENHLAINGMSNYDRNSENANSAIIVTISPNDYGNHPLDGIKFQRELEKKAYEIGDGKIPTQLYKDFKNNIPSKNFKSINPVFKGDYKLTNIRSVFPPYINEALIEGIETFSKKINNFNNDDTILSAVESRTSSPIKIERDENYLSNIKGIYPCGEGAGYAGGIMTSAIDGIKVAEAIAKIYKP